MPFYVEYLYFHEFVSFSLSITLNQVDEYLSLIEIIYEPVTDVDKLIHNLGPIHVTSM